MSDNKETDLNRATMAPGGCECSKCGCIFIGGETHTECGICANETKQAPAVEARETNPLLSILKDAAKWLHAAYDRPPQTPEAKAMLALVDLAIQFADEVSHADAEQSVEAGARELTDGQILDVFAQTKCATQMEYMVSVGRTLIARAALARASEAQAGEPVAWVRFLHDGLYEGPIMNCDRRRMEEIVHPKQSEWTALVVPTKAIAPPRRLETRAD